MSYDLLIISLIKSAAVIMAACNEGGEREAMGGFLSLKITNSCIAQRFVPRKIKESVGKIKLN